jgi:hypothetical protein
MGAVCSWRAEPATARGDTRSPRALTGALLGVACVAAIGMFVASALEQYGRSYGDPSAYRTALRIQPWRVSAQELLAVRLAVDGRSGDRAAADEARRTIAKAVQDHPWDPDVRLFAADVETLLQNPDGAAAWLAAHLRRFPGDVAPVELRRGSATGLAAPT